MISISKFRSIFHTLEATRTQVYVALRYCHSGSEWVHRGLDRNLDLPPNEKPKRVGLFWDLDNKPPNKIQPYEVANKLRIAASSFGVVRHMVAYANSHTFSHVPQPVRERRKERALLNRLENKGVIKRNEPYLCRVCGRKFYTNERLVNHFKQLHETEHRKRMNQIESAKGNRRVKLVAKYSMKMDKYKKAARAVLTPKVGYGLADELKRAGFWVQTVLDKPEAADLALQSHMVDMMDHRRVECVVLVSDDSDFVDVIEEAKLRCLKTVVIGDTPDGVLKRTADAAFSWEEILMGKAKKEAVSVVENWKDRDILKRLEWTYNPEVDKKKFNLNDTAAETSEDDDIKDIGDEVDDSDEDDRGSWWELDSDDDVSTGQSDKLSTMSVRRLIVGNVRKSKALRALRELAVAKSKLKELRAQFNNFSYRRHVARDAEERQRFTEKIIVLLLTVDGIEGSDLMVRSAKRSMVDELEAMLDVVDPQPGGKSLSFRRRTFDMPDGVIRKEIEEGVAQVVRMLDEAENSSDAY